MRTETQINDIFIVYLNPLISFIDYGLIEYVIKKFGSDALKRDMRSYCSEMIVFMKETTIKQLINHLPGQPEIPPKFSLIEAKISRNASECTLEELNTIRKRFCSEVKLSEIVFHLVAVVESNSFIVRWIVPSALVSNVVRSTKHVNLSFYLEYRITSFTLDGMWLFISKTVIDAMWSWLHVSDTKFKVHFHTMYKQIVFELGLAQITRHKLSSYFKKSLKCHQSISDSLSHELLNHKLPVSVVDFRVLAAAIEGFGSDCLKSVMSSYSKFMSTFLNESTAQQIINLSAIKLQPSGYSTVKYRIEEKPSQYTIYKLIIFQTGFCMIADISEFCFIMDEIATEMSGSFTISWLVPPAFVSVIIKFSKQVDHNFYHRFNITSFTLDQMWLYMSEAEIETVWSQVHVSDTKFKDQFSTMCKQIVCEIKMQNVSKDRLSSYFQSLDYHQQISNQLSLAVLEGESFVDFGVLKAVIERFGSDCLKMLVESYCNFMSIFVKQSTIEQLLHLSLVQSRVPENFLTAECKIKGEPFKYGLERLLEFQTRFCSLVNINKVCFIMGEVRKEVSGSFTVSWHIPSAAVSYIVKFTRNSSPSFYQEYKIASLTLDGMWIFLSDAEIDVLWHPSHFESQLLTMYRQIVRELEVQEILELELSWYLMDQNPKLRSYTSIQLSEAFLEHDLPLHFRFQSTIIEKFGSDCLKNVMKSFYNYVYTGESTVEQLVSLPPIPAQTLESKYFVSMESRNREDPSDCRLARLFDFQARFCAIVNIDEDFVYFIMDKIEAKTSDSFIVKWHVPSSLASDLLKSANQLDLKQTELFQEMNIPSLQLGGMWLYNHQLLPLGIQLRKRYQQSQGSPSPIEWIPSPTRKIFRLAMIQREKVQRGHIEDRFVRMTISGRVDDILHTKSQVELEDIFRNTLYGGEIILIEGAPGSGKSTLTVHM